MAENFRRITLSFYRYVILENPDEWRDTLYKDLSKIAVLGRIYLAEEGINAQISVPEHEWDHFIAYLNSSKYFSGVDLKIAVEDDGKSFINSSFEEEIKLLPMDWMIIPSM